MPTEYSGYWQHLLDFAKDSPIPFSKTVVPFHVARVIALSGRG